MTEPVKVIGSVDPATLKPKNNQEPQASDPGTKTVTQEDSVPLARLNAEIEKRKGVETTLSELANDFIQEVPEAFRELIPAELSAKGKIDFIRKASKAGLFNGTPQDGPGSGRPGKKQATNYDEMSTGELLSAGLKGN